ncbi:dihydrofolate reductase [Candidatus Micrarchaeota archaeon]|nr:dihydrofolate reductase [Candidatus Micrarchaeota archaeon]
MKRIILFIATSLDGYIAREDHSIDWLFTDQDYGYKEFYDSVDTVLIGRTTYEKMLEMGTGYHYKGKKGYVFSRDKKTKKDENVEFVSDIVPFVKKLKKDNENKTERENEGNIWVVGGSEIVSVLLNADLIDEIMVFVHPIILGKGIPLFKNIKEEKKLKLKNTESYSSGLVKLHYMFDTVEARKSDT